MEVSSAQFPHACVKFIAMHGALKKAQPKLVGPSKKNTIQSILTALS
jgi:hypothetical protein